MFFILLALNLILYIAGGVSLYNGVTDKGTIFLVLGGLTTVVTLVYYVIRSKKRTNEGSGLDIGDALECAIIPFDCDGPDMPDCDAPDCDGVDGLDCGDLDCGGVDCTP